MYNWHAIDSTNHFTLKRSLPKDSWVTDTLIFVIDGKEYCGYYQSDAGIGQGYKYGFFYINERPNLNRKEKLPFNMEPHEVEKWRYLREPNE